MTLRAFALTAALLRVVVPFALQAQQPAAGCSSAVTGDACQKGVDLFAYLVPQLGAVASGGSVTPGQASLSAYSNRTGHLPTVSVGLRTNFLAGALPAINRISISSSGPSNAEDIPTRSYYLKTVSLDASVGVFPGIPAGVTNVLGVDALLALDYTPGIDEPELRLDPDGSGVRIGWGARLGVLQESVVTPGVSFSFVGRSLPRLEVEAGSGSARIMASDIELNVQSWRAILSKSFIGFQLLGGLGRDHYDAVGEITSSVGLVEGDPVPTAQDVNRTSVFFGLALDIGRLRLAGDFGHSGGGTIRTFNDFASSEAAAGRNFGSLAVRIVF